MTPARIWAAALARFSPEVRASARAAIARLRRRLPGAVEFVYDNYNALVLGFGSTDRPSDALFSVVLYPRHVSLCFLDGAHLPDPEQLLQGEGSRVRHIRLAGGTTLDAPAVQALVSAAIDDSGQRFSRSRRTMIVRAVSKKQRPRRPS